MQCSKSTDYSSKYLQDTNYDGTLCHSIQYRSGDKRYMLVGPRMSIGSTIVPGSNGNTLVIPDRRRRGSGEEVSDHSLFGLDRYTGQIRTLRSFTETDEAQHKLLILVKDNGNVSLSATATVIVKVVEPKEAFAASDVKNPVKDEEENNVTFYLIITLGSVSVLFVISIIVLIVMQCSKSTDYSSKYLQDTNYDGTLCHSIQYRSGDKRYMLVGPRMSIGSTIVPGSNGNTLVIPDRRRRDSGEEVSDHSLFGLDRYTGQIRTLRSFTETDEAQHKLLILVKDNGNVSLSATATVIVKVVEPKEAFAASDVKNPVKDEEENNVTFYLIITLGSVSVLFVISIIVLLVMQCSKSTDYSSKYLQDTNYDGTLCHSIQYRSGDKRYMLVGPRMSIGSTIVPGSNGNTLVIPDRRRRGSGECSKSTDYSSKYLQDTNYDGTLCHSIQYRSGDKRYMLVGPRMSIGSTIVPGSNGNTLVIPDRRRRGSGEYCWIALCISFLLGIGQQVSAQIRYSIPEEVKEGTDVGNVAKDLGLEVSSLVDRQFRIVSGSKEELFQINQDNGVLYVHKKINRESVCAGSGVCMVHLKTVIENPLEIHYVEVEIADINDHSPSFPEKEQRLRIYENTLPGADYQLQAARDPDSGTNSVRSYKLSPNDNFEIRVRESDEDKMPFLVLKKAVDREIATTYKLLLTAVDGGNPPRSGTLNITITILDINDNRPLFSRETYSATLQENSVIGTVVIRVNATDMDDGPNSDIEYNFATLNSKEHDVFELDQVTGEIQVYKLDIQASDKGHPPMSANCRVVIKIIDVNDNRPEIEITSLSKNIPEDSKPGTVISLISVTDKDAGINGKVICQLNKNIPFELKPSFKDNMYSLVTKDRLDREMNSQYDITITASDLGQPSLTASTTLSVQISDVNDNAPEYLINPLNLYLMENNAAGSSIISVSASDRDTAENAVISYHIIRGDGTQNDLSSFLNINSETGVVYSLKSFDFETLKTSHFHVLATDSGTPSLSSNVTVNVFILDQNDNVPVILYPVSANGSAEGVEEVPRNVNAGHLVTKVRAYDADIGYNGWLLFSLQEVSDHSLFGLDRYTGQIRTLRSFTETDEAQHKLLILVKDNGNVSLSATATVIVKVVEPKEAFAASDVKNPVKDEEENNVTFYLIITLGSVSVLFVISIIVLLVMQCSKSTDYSSKYLQDTNYDGTLCHSIQYRSGDKRYMLVGPRMSIGSTIVPGSNGNTLVIPDRRRRGSGEPSMSSLKTITVLISDVNDNSPEFSFSPYSFYVMENNVPGKFLFSISATDKDSNENAIVSYHIWRESSEENKYMSFININSENGEIYALKSFDFETVKTFHFQVVATDSGTPSLSSNVTVNVFILDQNDNVPVILYPVSANGSAEGVEEVPRNVNAGHLVTKVRAYDADIGYNGWLLFSLQEVSDHSLFGLDRYTGQIRTLRSFTETDEAQHKLLILVKDNGNVSLSATATVIVKVVEPKEAFAASDVKNPVKDKEENNVTFYLIITLGSVSVLFVISIIVLLVMQCSKSTDYSSKYLQDTNYDGTLCHSIQYRSGDKRYMLVGPRMSIGSTIVPGSNGNTLVIPDRRRRDSGEEVSDHSLFGLDRYTGQIRTLRSFTETDEAQHKLLILVKDNGNVSLSATATVIVKVVEPKEAFAASDVKNPVKDEEENNFHVLATDSGTPSLSSNVTVNVFILDQNDNVPVILYPVSANGSAEGVEEVPRNVNAGHLVTKVRAYDADIGYNGWLLFSLQEVSDHSLFGLDRYTGQIRTLRSFTETDEAQHKLLILVKDNGNVSLSATATVIVKVVEPKEAFAASDVKNAVKDEEENNVTFYLIITLGSVSVLFVISIIVLLVMQCTKSTDYSSKYLQDTNYDGTLCHSIQYRSGDKRYMLVGPRMSIGSTIVPGSNGNTLVIPDRRRRDSGEEVSDHSLFGLDRYTGQIRTLRSFTETDEAQHKLLILVKDNGNVSLSATATVIFKVVEPKEAFAASDVKNPVKDEEENNVTFYLIITLGSVSVLFVISIIVLIVMQCSKSTDYSSKYLQDTNYDGTLCHSIQYRSGDKRYMLVGPRMSIGSTIVPGSNGNTLVIPDRRRRGSGEEVSDHSLFGLDRYTGQIRTLRSFTETDEAQHKLLILVKDNGNVSLSATATVIVKVVEPKEAFAASDVKNAVKDEEENNMTFYLIITLGSVSVLFVISIIVLLVMQCSKSTDYSSKYLQDTNYDGTLCHSIQYRSGDKRYMLVGPRMSIGSTIVPGSNGNTLVIPDRRRRDSGEEVSDHSLFGLDRYTGQIRTLRSFTETDEAQHKLLILVKDNGNVSLSATATVIVKVVEPKEAFAASDVENAVKDEEENNVTFYLIITLGSVSVLFVISIIVLIVMQCSKSTDYSSKYLQDTNYDGTLCHSIQYRSGDKRYMLVGPRMSIGSTIGPGSNRNTLVIPDRRRRDSGEEVSDHSLFGLDRYTGQIRTLRSFTETDEAQHKLLILVKDNGNVSLSATATVIVKVVEPKEAFAASDVKNAVKDEEENNVTFYLIITLGSVSVLFVISIIVLLVMQCSKSTDYSSKYLQDTNYDGTLCHSIQYRSGDKRYMLVGPRMSIGSTIAPGSNRNTLVIPDRRRRDSGEVRTFTV
ncbi:hypothetical protein G5714_014503 [Onychostoma macrolepis]|uniref:Cadherin domain-containing protein n=1 Tax=Onychostoma macrolepis TaxID=369639 RepID=A0A7J6CHI6_9TELE|nr:hypothetical protein G5714_014503 [Onychostoma macrolepis]